MNSVQQSLHPDSLYNRPAEVGLRALIILGHLDGGLDLQRLTQYDYLLVHSEDLDGPPSLHPRSPVRAGELLARRGLVQDSVERLFRKGLLSKDYMESGITYRATDAGRAFLSYLRSKYSADLSERARWVISHVHAMSTGEIERNLQESSGKWNYEFEGPYFAEEDIV